MSTTIIPTSACGSFKACRFYKTDQRLTHRCIVVNDRDFDWRRHSRHGSRISLTDSLGLFGHPRLLSSILVILKRRVHGAKQGFLAEWLRQEANGACPQGPLSRVFIPMARDEDDRDMVRSSQLTL